MSDNSNNFSDNQLWDNFINGDEEAFRIIYESHIQMLFKYGCHFSSDGELIKDSIHDLFIDLFHYRSGLKKNDNIKAYLFVSLKRNILKKIRRSNKLKIINIDVLPFDYAIISGDNMESSENQERLERLEKAMKNLSARQKEAIYLKFVFGLDYKELSKILGINYQASRNLIYKGIEKLRAII